MKSIFFQCFLLLSVSFANCRSNPGFKKVPDNKIDRQKLAKATALAQKLMDSMKAGNFYQLTSDEAETRMINAFTEDIQKSSYETVKGMFGEYQSLSFDQLMKPTDGTLYEIYRFRGKFASKDAKVEIRVVLNSEGKLAGFFIKPWKEEL